MVDRLIGRRLFAINEYLNHLGIIADVYNFHVAVSDWSIALLEDFQRDTGRHVACHVALSAPLIGQPHRVSGVTVTCLGRYILGLRNGNK